MAIRSIEHTPPNGYPQEIQTHNLESLQWEEKYADIRSQIQDAFTFQPDDITLFNTFARVGKAFEDYYLPKENISREQRKYAFIVHPRDPIDTDIQRQFPALSPRYMPYDTAMEIFQQLPPMILGEFNGLTDASGSEVKGWLISAPITAGELYGTRSLKVYDNAKRKVIDTARFAKKQLGVEIIGLGETLGSLSKFGNEIEKNVDELKVTTGHSYTVHLVGEVLKNGAEALDIDMKNSTLAVVGAAGAIGSSASKILADQVGKIILIDEKRKQTELEKIASEFSTETVTTSDPSSIKAADMVVVATSSPHPFITKDIVSPGTVIVDDSQPVNMTKQAAIDAGVLLLHPIAQVPDGVERTFDFSLPEGSDFSCAAEVMALAATGDYQKRTIGRLTDVEQIRNIASLTEVAGIKPARMQSFGEYIAHDYLAKIKSLRS